MRGKDRHSKRSSFYKGITPAYAGKRGRQSSSLEVQADHPCVCGEKALNDDAELGNEGSPLRMRGKGGE